MIINDIFCIYMIIYIMCYARSVFSSATRVHVCIRAVLHVNICACVYTRVHTPRSSPAGVRHDVPSWRRERFYTGAKCRRRKD